MKSLSGSAGKILSIAVRLATLFSKFFLIILLAKLLTPQEVGTYGLIAATAGYLVYILGLEFYCYTTRELAASQKEIWTAIVKNHSTLMLASYVIAIPIIVSTMYLQNIKPHIIALFIIILIIEHVGQEQSRFLIATHRPLASNLILFLRTSAWVFLIAPILWFVPNSRSIEVVLYAWLIGGITSILLGLTISHISLDFGRAIDYKWIKRGLIVSIPILISTLSARGIFTFDRYLIEAFQGLEKVAPYVLFIGISNAMISLLDSGVYAYHYPTMIRFAKTSPTEFKKTFQSMLIQTVIVSTGYSASCLLLIKYALTWIGKPIYLDEIRTLYILIFAFFVHSISMVFHYSLYALKKDKTLFYCNLAMLPIFFIVAKLLNFYEFEDAVSVALLLVFTISLAWKSRRHFIEMKTH